MTDAHILVIGAGPKTDHCLAQAARQQGVWLSLAAHRAQALRLLRQQPVHAVVADRDWAELDDDFLRLAADLQPLVTLVVLVDPRADGPRPRRIHAPWARWLPKPTTTAAAGAILACVRETARRAWSSGPEVRLSSLTETK